ncbi:flagellar basal body P-ring formation chaperone FlgA [Brevundimonas aurifodinae]|uniref:Flagellar basal body P-ring formation chaperone FlgA n=2 Tax=Brevundimonas TaxID=41275 RepID=A0ABV1NLK0_9CAUL|nr:MAG: flagella basal body P-ring formation protein FlgA [Brevundimonas sp. 12-68-7]OYX30292.1 MAG: flagella basal body P-ring formation protein FlgA [Brevundimonas subvibrioides]
MRALLFIAALALSAGPALAGPVTLRANPVDDDGRVTLGDIFDGAGAASGVVVASRAGPSVVFEAGQLQALAARSGLQWANPQNLRRVVVRHALLASGAPAATATPAGTTMRPAAVAGATAAVLTYARNIAAGDVIQPEDVVWTDVQSHLATGGGPSDAEEVVGLSARRALRAGAVVGARDLARPQVIARNDTVQVAFASGGVTLTVTGRAQRGAAVGEVVAITNLTSGRTIEAVASGPGRAVAGPEAQAARSSQFAAVR